MKWNEEPVDFVDENGKSLLSERKVPLKIKSGLSYIDYIKSSDYRESRKRYIIKEYKENRHIFYDSNL